MRRLAISAGLLACTLAVPMRLAAVAGTSPGHGPGIPTPIRTVSETHVEVTDRFFTPTTVPVPRGGTVVFDFVGQDHHTATDDSGMDLYDSGLVDGGGSSFSHTFEAAGAYRFTCTPHPSMGGRVEVPIRAAPARGRTHDRFVVTWASAAPDDGFVQDVQIRRPGRGWEMWRVGTRARSGSFRPDRGTGVYRFRARLRNDAGDASFWSLKERVRVTR